MWNLPTQERLLHWQAFRRHLDTLSFEQCVHETNKLWWQAPISNQYYCQTLSEQWPGPWQLIIDNVYDDIARALGMLYTVYYTQHSCKLELVCGKNESSEYNLVLVDDGKYALNWDTSVSVNTPNQEYITRRFAPQELIKREEYESSNTSNKTRRQKRTNRIR
jgi:hypothetical protein